MSDDHVVEDFDADEFAGFGDPSGDVAFVEGGFGVAGGVVVGDHERGGAVGEGVAGGRVDACERPGQVDVEVGAVGVPAGLACDRHGGEPCRAYRPFMRTTPDMAGDHPCERAGESAGNPAAQPARLGEVCPADDGVEDLETHRPPLGGVVLVQGPAAGDQQRPMRGGKPAQRHRIPCGGRRQQDPVAAAVALGPLHMGRVGSGAAAGQRP